RDALAATLSKGQRQKLLICGALLHQPEVFLFDEPLVGLDPAAQRDLKDALRALRDQGAAILVSTHMLETAERLCDRALVLHRGRVIAEGGSTLCGPSSAWRATPPWRISSSRRRAGGWKAGEAPDLSDELARPGLPRRTAGLEPAPAPAPPALLAPRLRDRKSTRLNSSHVKTSLAVFCLEKTKL